MSEEYNCWVSEILELVNLQNATRLVDEGENVLIECDVCPVILSKRRNNIIIHPLNSCKSEFVYCDD